MRKIARMMIQSEKKTNGFALFAGRLRYPIAALILLSLLLVACGGGTSGTSSDTSQGSAATSASGSTDQASGSEPSNSQVLDAPNAQSTYTSLPTTASQPSSGTPPDSTAPDATATQPVDTQPAAPQSPSTSATPAPSETTDDLVARYQEEIDELIAATERVRGLKFLSPPKVVLMSQESFTRQVAEGMVEERFEDLDSEEALYKLLGLLDPEISIRETYADMFSTGTTGYYDSEKKELVVPISESGIDITTRMVIVHELVHALTDQHFDFHKTSTELADNDETDKYYALSAVIEGDAIEVEKRYYMEELTEEEKSSLAASDSEGQQSPETTFSSIPSAEEIIQYEIDRQRALQSQGPPDSPEPPRLPQFLADSFQFSYSHGSNFVRSLVGRDPMDQDALTDEDFKVINELYSEIPASTEQIYFSEKYQTDEPLEVAHQAADLPGYELVETNTWGALSFVGMFDQVLGYQVPDLTDPRFAEEQAIDIAFVLSASARRPAVEGWGGDLYSLWYNGSEVAMAMTYRGDEAKDAQELAETMREYISTAMNVGEPETSGDTSASGYSITWSGEDFAWLKVEGDTVRFVAASDPAVGEELVAFYDAV